MSIRSGNLFLLKGRGDNERRRILKGSILFFGGSLLVVILMVGAAAAREASSTSRKNPEESRDVLLSAGLGNVQEMEEGVSPEGRDNAEEVVRIVNRLTDLAVQTHLNADYVPGMVTVFYGRDLENRGIRSAGEALNLVPGMNLSLSSHIYWKTVARGVPRPFAAGHVKLLLNGIPLTTTFGIDLVPNLPIEQVDRIEIIRGPGATLHGEQAVTGVVNIVTLDRGSRIYGGIGSYSTVRGGGAASLVYPDQQLRMSLNFSGAESEGTDVNVGASELAYAPSLDYAEAVANVPVFEAVDGVFSEDYRASKTGIFSLDWRKTSFRAQWLESRRDGWYQTDQAVVSLSQHIALAPSLDADAVFSFLNRDFDSDLEYGTRSTSLPENSEGWIYEFDYTEQQLRAGLDLSWRHGADSRMLFGYSFTQSSLSDVKRASRPGEIYEGDDRRINGLRLQEQWQPHDRITLIGGVGYDHYSDIGEQFSPKIASVFRLNAQRSAIRRHILKIQYGRAFRPPTFLETRAALNTSNSKPETIDTFELSYITRKFDETLRFTAFISELDACITGISCHQETYDIKGFELEFEKPLFPDILELDANLSYAVTENQDTGDEISGSANWLSNIEITYRPFRWISLSLRLHSVFDRNRDMLAAANDPEDTHLLDATAFLRYPGNRKWTLRFGVKNAFREDIRLYSVQTELKVANDFVVPGDEQPDSFWWMSLSYDF